MLDRGGRLLLMHQAVRALSSQLTLYAKPSRKAAFLEHLIATSDELKSYCVSPEELAARRGRGGQPGRPAPPGVGADSGLLRRADGPAGGGPPGPG